ncbi:MAG: four helix bundle protein [Patescibacteria group bacterium]
MEDRIQDRKKCVTFQDLEVWKNGHVLVLEVYALTKRFPKEEIYGLVSQMRRAAISVTSNIAEGFGRRSMKDKIHFYIMARGSLIELQNQLIVSRDVGYIPVQDFQKIEYSFETVHRLLNALLTKSQELLG